MSGGCSWAAKSVAAKRGREQIERVNVVTGIDVCIVDIARIRAGLADFLRVARLHKCTLHITITRGRLLRHAVVAVVY